MAETTALTSVKEARAQLDKANADRAALREQYRQTMEKAKKAQAEAVAQEKSKNKELLKQVKGPDLEQVGGDLAGFVVGEGVFRLIQLGLTKIGAESPLWYTVVPGLLGTVLYAVTYPRKDEGIMRAAARATGLYWQIIALHDGVSVLMGSGQKRAQEVAAQQREIVALQQQLAAARQPAAK